MSFRDLTGKVVLVFGWPSKERAKFTDPGALLKDFANFQSFTGFSTVSILWNGLISSLSFLTLYDFHLKLSLGKTNLDLFVCLFSVLLLLFYTLSIHVRTNAGSKASIQQY